MGRSFLNFFILTYIHGWKASHPSHKEESTWIEPTLLTVPVTFFHSVLSFQLFYCCLFFVLFFRPAEKKVVKINPSSTATEVWWSLCLYHYLITRFWWLNWWVCAAHTQTAAPLLIYTLFSLQRLQKRAERFSLPASAESKKALRAARYDLFDLGRSTSCVY